MKAKQSGVEKLRAYVVSMEQHIPYMTEGFEEYVEYWNSKLENCPIIWTVLFSALTPNISSL